MAGDLFRAIMNTTADADLRLGQDTPRGPLRIRFISPRGMRLERQVDRDVLLLARDQDDQLAWLIENTYSDLKCAEEKENSK